MIIETMSSVLRFTIHLCQHPPFQAVFEALLKFGNGGNCFLNIFAIMLHSQEKSFSCVNEGKALLLSICRFVLYSAKNCIRGFPCHEARPKTCLMYFTLRQDHCNFQHLSKVEKLTCGNQVAGDALLLQYSLPSGSDF